MRFVLLKNMMDVGASTLDAGIIKLLKAGMLWLIAVDRPHLVEDL